MKAPKTRARVKPTQKNVDAAKYDPELSNFQWFTDPAGFGLELHESGRKSFVLSGRRANGSTFRKVIKQPDVKSARKVAIRWLSELGDNKDPWTQKRGGQTLRQVMLDWMQSRDLKAATAGQVPDQLKRYLGDWFERPYREISTKDVERRFNQIKRGEIKGQKGMIGTPKQARDTFRYLRTILRYVESHDKTYQPPTHILTKRLLPPEKEDEDELSPYEKPYTDEQLKWLGDALCRWWPQGLPEGDRLFTLWLAYTGCRRTETSKLTWSMVESDTVVLPSATTKNGKVHRLPITSQMRCILDDAKCVAGDSDKVFRVALQGSEVPRNVRYSLSLLNHKEPLPDFYRHNPQHRWRHTMGATLYDQLGYNELVIAWLLNHKKKGSITAHYSRKPPDLDVRADALQKYNNHLAKLFEQT
ncbi:MAG: integrase family protein [Pseudomonadaceae bacterium]|nr:integrase family protein [Pseudomonadaceae bacterium]